MVLLMIKNGGLSPLNYLLNCLINLAQSNFLVKNICTDDNGLFVVVL